MAEELLAVRIGLMILSAFVLAVFVKLKRNDRVGTQFLVVVLIFWSVVFLIASIPEILDSILNLTGLDNRAQFLFGISLIIIIYLLYMQTQKSKSIIRINRLIRDLALSNFQKEIMNLSSKNLDVIIIITAKNESKTIGTVIDKINQIDIPHSYGILVVNDGSTDDTEQIARSKNAMVVNHFFNLGIGSAIKTGFMASRFFKPEIVINIDADGQHDPKYIPEIISKITNHKADLVYASRFSKSSNYNTTVVRTIGNKFYTKLVNKIAKISITDVTSGYRALRFDKLNSILFVAETNFAIELAIRAGRNGLKIIEIPAQTESRNFGMSQFHKIEGYILYNVNAIKQIFNAFVKSPDHY